MLPDTILTALATKAHFQTLEDLITAGWSPTHVQKHGAEIISILKDYDNLFKSTKEHKIKAHAEKKKLDTAVKLEENQIKVKEERARQHEIHIGQPKPPHPSRAKKTKIFADSITPNTPIQVHQLMHYVSPTMSASTDPIFEGENIAPASPFYSPIPHYPQPSYASIITQLLHIHLPVHILTPLSLPPL